MRLNCSRGVLLRRPWPQWVLWLSRVPRIPRLPLGRSRMINDCRRLWGRQPLKRWSGSDCWRRWSSVAGTASRRRRCWGSAGRRCGGDYGVLKSALASFSRPIASLSWPRRGIAGELASGVRLGRTALVEPLSGAGAELAPAEAQTAAPLFPRSLPRLRPSRIASPAMPPPRPRGRLDAASTAADGVLKSAVAEDCG